MAKSYIDPLTKMTRQEKKNLHHKNPNKVIPKGRRKYQSVLFKIKATLNHEMLQTWRKVDWDSIVNKPEVFPRTTLECEVVAHVKDN